MYILPCVKYIARGNLVYKTGSPKPVPCHSLEGWDGLGDFKRRGRMYTCG